MPKHPYILCRYQITAGEDRLDSAGQMAFFRENQGQFKPYQTRRDRPPANALIMEAEPLTTEGGNDAISFYVGYQPGYRLKTGYDARNQKRTSDVVHDDNIKAAHVVAVPALGCMAIEDRVGDHNIPQGTAVRALRSIARATLDEGDINVLHLSDDDVRKILEDWELVQYDYVIRPLNPISVSDLADIRSEAMKVDNVAKDSGRLQPKAGDTMVAKGGIITQTQAVVDAGYGQSGGRAITPDGNEARFPKPTFHMNKEKNFAERDKPRFVKIMFDTDDEGTPDTVAIARTLVRFYGHAKTT
jgi:hypothetical protein